MRGRTWDESELTAVRIGRTVKGQDYKDIAETLPGRTECAVQSKCLEMKWRLPSWRLNARRKLGTKTTRDTMNKGDYLTIPTTAGNRLFWLIEAVNVGDIGQESLVLLRRLSQRPGQDEHGTEHETVMVPEVILRRARMLVLTPEVPDEQDGGVSPDTAAFFRECAKKWREDAPPHGPRAG